MTTVAELREKSAELRAFFDQHLPYDRPTPVLADFVRVQHELMWGGGLAGRRAGLETPQFRHHYRPMRSTATTSAWNIRSAPA